MAVEIRGHGTWSELKVALAARDPSTVITVTWSVFPPSPTLRTMCCVPDDPVLSSIWRCTRLTTLSLFFDFLDECAVTDGAFTGLSSLPLLEDLALTDLRLRAIPDALARCTNLRGLWLNNCRDLAELPSWLGDALPHLEILVLSGCAVLTRLPRSLGLLEALKELWLDGTSIQDPPSYILDDAPDEESLARAVTAYLRDVPPYPERHNEDTGSCASAHQPETPSGWGAGPTKKIEAGNALHAVYSRGVGGDIHAQLEMGYRYEYADGVPLDVYEASRWYRLALEQGDIDAAYKLHNLYRMRSEYKSLQAEARCSASSYRHAAGQDPPDACPPDPHSPTSRTPPSHRPHPHPHPLSVLRYAIVLNWELGVPHDPSTAVALIRGLAESEPPFSPAQLALGRCYQRGIGVEIDARKAVRWYKRAALHNLAGAEFWLGWCLEHGLGVVKDEEAAVRWHRIAAQKGHLEAQSSLGMVYASGRGVEKDEKAAVGWYLRAAAQGDGASQCNLGRCYAMGCGVEKDDEAAVAWYRRAATQGVAAAQYNLGSCLHVGRGVEKNEEIAAEWFRRAAEQGDAKAQCRLGVCYGLGSGVPQDERLAAEWCLKAAQQGNSDAQYSLGRCYEKGGGVTKDLRLAVMWYRKAAEQGDQGAKARLKVLGKKNKKK